MKWESAKAELEQMANGRFCSLTVNDYTHPANTFRHESYRNIEYHACVENEGVFLSVGGSNLRFALDAMRIKLQIGNHEEMPEIDDDHLDMERLYAEAEYKENREGI